MRAGEAGPYSGLVVRSTIAVLTVLVVAALVATAAAPHPSAAPALAGTWTASGPPAKIVLVLRHSGKLYVGTYTQAGHKALKVQARADVADGLTQLMLTFPGNRSSLCGLRGAEALLLDRHRDRGLHPHLSDGRLS